MLLPTSIERPLPSDPREILLVKLSSMGDILHALPVACALKDTFPAVRISWVVDERYAQILRHHSCVDEVLTASAPGWVSRWPIRQDIPRGLFNFGVIRSIRQRRFDLVIDLQGLWRSALIGWASRSPVRLGFREAGEGAPLFYTHRVSARHRQHVVEKYLELVRPIVGPVAEPRFGMEPTAQGLAARAQFLESFDVPADGEYVLVAPKSSRWYKDWPAERFAELVGHLEVDRRLPVFLLGGAADRACCQQIARSAGIPSRMVVGQSLETVQALLAGARLLVGLDSGPTHLAAALGTPVVAIFGPTDPSRTSPWGSQELCVIECSRCRLCQSSIRWKSGWPGSRHTCLIDLPVRVVLERVHQALDGHANAEPSPSASSAIPSDAGLVSEAISVPGILRQPTSSTR